MADADAPPGGDPDKTAVVEGDRSLTFADLADRSGRVHGMLGALGIGRRERVAAMLPNGNVLVAMSPSNWAASNSFPAPTHYWELDPSGTFTQVSAGRLHTCGLKTAGTVVCWRWRNGATA